MSRLLFNIAAPSTPCSRVPTAACAEALAAQFDMKTSTRSSDKDLA
jgi:hypothetical protein